MSHSPDVHIFGIRHHGPGSARSLNKALKELGPDTILVEGPPDAAEVLSLLVDNEMKPPVALLVYRPDQPDQAVYYPFATYSPEWQALHYGLTHQLPVRFMDLPVAHRFALNEQDVASITVPSSLSPETETETETTVSEDKSESQAEASALNARADPLGWLAQVAGYSDGERWWEQMVEQRVDSAGLFTAIGEAMAALREELGSSQSVGDARMENLREAYMRQSISQARQAGFKRIAVVCGAWHSPALLDLTPQQAKLDTALLKGLPKVKVEASWIPWTYGRLTFASGYGAGVESPGWYHHLWSYPKQTVIRWLTRVARLLREQDLEVSSAHLIEAVRLAETLASLRDHPLPGLPELQEAIQTILCYGETLPMQVIHEKLAVGERLGQVPPATPMVPLQQDLQREQKRLRVSPEATEKVLDLDLRKSTDLDRSYLFHRLNLLGVNWGKLERVRGKSGTFHELWRLRWQPEFAIGLIEAGVWGNTIGAAATGYVRQASEKMPDLPGLTKLIERVMLADLPEAVEQLMQRLQNEAALTSDVAHLMEALPALANVSRYGSVRQMDLAMVGQVVAGLVARICIGLPGACASLNDEAAREMFKRLLMADQAIALLQNQPQLEMWHGVLLQLADQAGLHGLIAGGCCRLLLDNDRLETGEVARRMGLALSIAGNPAQAAAWVEGLLQNSGLFLIHDDKLWQLLDNWVSGLSKEAFVELLPLLRRTFSTFAPAERRQLGEKVKHGKALHSLQGGYSATASADFDQAQAEASLPVVATLLGLAKNLSQ